MVISAVGVGSGLSSRSVCVECDGFVQYVCVMRCVWRHESFSAVTCMMGTCFSYCFFLSKYIDLCDKLL